MGCYTTFLVILLTHRLILLQLKYTLLVFTHWCVVVHILHQDLNLHGRLHLFVTVILRKDHQYVLKTGPTEGQE